jgi:uncharacterized protein
VTEALLLGLAAGLAGAVNAVGGGGSLISFPALVAAGYSPVTANVTNAIAMLPGYLGGSVAYRAELAGQAPRLRLLAPVSAVGAVVGACLLLVGPEAAFEAAAPLLVLAACGILLLQPRLAQSAVRAGGHSRWLLPAQFAACVYGGYFGAGLGIILLAVLGAGIDDSLQRLNALKGLLSLVVAILTTAVFAIGGPVAWGAAAGMAVAAMIGGHAGVAVARRLSPRVLRLSVAAFGVVAAAYLAWSAT